ncbi:hypothetical protein H1C71_003776 [Ictidomys tridecemlineatus]|nr:hypothetical protein H1C71_003776 [Ictidomys tridecemlineatus]
MQLHSALTVRWLSTGRTCWLRASRARCRAAPEEGMGSWRMDPWLSLLQGCSIPSKRRRPWRSIHGWSAEHTHRLQSPEENSLIVPACAHVKMVPSNLHGGWLDGQAGSEVCTLTLVS